MINMLLKNRSAQSRIIAILLIFSLVSWEGIISISQYCLCEINNPKIELSSSCCDEKDNCCSEVMHVEKFSASQKLVNQRCVNSFSEQTQFLEEKKEQNIKHVIDIVILNSYTEKLSEIRFQNSNSLYFISHNRFIDTSQSVLLI